jgi:hypothetical protein
MKISIGIIAACAGTLVFVQASPGQAQERRHGGFIIPLVAKSDSGKRGQNRATVNTSRSNIKHQGLAAPGKPPKAGIADSHELEEISITNRKAAPGKPNQSREAITTTRSNIKQNSK